MLTGLGTLIVRCILHVFLALGLQNVTFFRGFKFFFLILIHGLDAVTSL